jgi:hypothetical protein
MNGDRAGSVTHELRVPDFRTPPIALSQVLLASSESTRVTTANVDPVLQSVLDAPPTAIRQFNRTDTLTVFAELYDNRKKAAERIALLTTITSPDGQVVYRRDEQLEATAFDPSRKSYVHRADIPLGDLPTGHYVLRVTAQPQTGPGDEIRREVAFSVREEQTVALN